MPASQQPPSNEDATSSSTQAADLLVPPSADSPEFFGRVASPTLVSYRADDADVTVPAGNGEVISDIQVRFFDRDGNPVDGKTRDFIITREFDLQPGDVYDAETARQGLSLLNDLVIIQDATLELEPTDVPNEVVMVVNIVERRSRLLIPGLQLDPFSVSPGIVVTPPPASVLPGPTRAQSVGASPGQVRGFNLPLSIQSRNLGGNNQTLALGLLGGTDVVAADLTFTDPWIAGNPRRIGYGINAFGLAYIATQFTGGPRDVELPGGDTAWVHRLGGGIQFRQQFRPPGVDGALGLSYQRVTVQDDLFLFGGDIETEDELGNPLTVSEDGRDDLLTINFALVVDERDSRRLPTQGLRFVMSTDQYIPIGEANIFANRLAANYTQHIPLNLFGFAEGPRTLILNVQGGTIIGDAPPYEAFSLGGSRSVRGYGAGELGTGRSFVQATAEYRFPLANFRVFRSPINLRGSLFADFATDLGSDDTVIGRPGEVRDKPGTGAGGGFGLNAYTSIGLFRLDVGFSDNGDAAVYFNIGDRF